MIEFVQNDGLVIEVYWSKKVHNFSALIAPDWSKKTIQFYITPDFGPLHKAADAMEAAIVLMECASIQDTLNGLLDEYDDIDIVTRRLPKLIEQFNGKWKDES